MNTIPTPTMKWRKTWPDVVDDFVCINSEGEPIARIYRHHDGKRWSWHMNAWQLPGMNGIVEGHPREAAVAAEQAWRAAQALQTSYLTGV